MSKKETTVIITPPGRLRTEGFVSTGHQCGYCLGKGWFYGPMGKEEETIVCPDCGGAGEVMAMVTVEWKPYKRQ